MVAGEPSGDQLGAALIGALKRRFPTLEAEGIGGPAMAAEGFASHCAMDAISIMGLDGLIGNARRILSIRRRLIDHFIEHPPDLFVGIDVPDFNLTMEQRLREAGIPTIHYVSPTVWAWRGYRIRRIRKAIDHMLVLFPFEEQYYMEQRIPVTFVGHPAADSLLHEDQGVARAKLGLRSEALTVALLPGSRKSEIKRLGLLFVQVAAKLSTRIPGIQFVVPHATASTRAQFEALTEGAAASIDLQSVDGQSQRAMISADVVLLASGTAALEAALLGRPMVVAYRISPVTYALARLVMKVKYYSMPNHLLPTPEVPEFIQGDATVVSLSNAVERYLSDDTGNAALVQRFSRIREQLSGGASQKAAGVVARFLDQARSRPGP